VRARLWMVVLALLCGLAERASADPWADYVLHCQGCHRPDGSGSAGGAPPFAGNLHRFVLTPEGRAYLLRVPGVAHAELDDARLATLLNWILAQFDPAPTGMGWTPFSPEEVAKLRHLPLLSVPQARHHALLAADEGEARKR